MKMNDKKRRELEEDARRYIWHPFTQMKDWEKETPIIIERGSGLYLYDIHGDRYLDGVSSLWVNLHGHRKRALDQALRHQLDKIAHSTLLGLTNVPAIELAKRLVQLAPRGIAKIFYSDNGSTAVEIAIKMALQYWQLKGRPKKTGYLSLTNAYHGDTIGAVSVGGIDLFHERYRPLLFPTFKVGAPYCYRCFLGKTYPQCEMACADEVEKVLAAHHDAIAAVVVEPLVQGTAGIIVWPPGYLSHLREVCTRYHVLMIVDEVLTGFGRTGRMFACQQEGVAPDLMAVAKGLSGGYLPIAATLTTQEIYEAFLGEYEEFKTFFHGHSYTGNQLACAVALASLQVFEKEKVLEKLPRKIAQLTTDLAPLRDHPHVGDVRQLGFIAGIELVKDKQSKKPYPLSERRGFRVAAEARTRGMLIRPLGNVIVLMPPLSVDLRTLRRMVRILIESIHAATAT
ncbi:MAG TPA: adenosylmethionine--8-amino-7-oxononanoate transaminase [Nitrospiria bacterium]|nr:adenosylmethionine--8-amino-7-oxononanoate transaminase [Nitrospiria bacterium]